MGCNPDRIWNGIRLLHHSYEDYWLLAMPYSGRSANQANIL